MQEDLTPVISCPLCCMNTRYCWGRNLQFASYLYTFESYSHSCKFYNHTLRLTVRMHSDAIFFSIGASRMKTFIKNQCSSTHSLSLVSITLQMPRPRQKQSDYKLEQSSFKLIALFCRCHCRNWLNGNQAL